MSVKLLTEYHLEFLTLKGGSTGSSESTHVKLPHFWKSYVTAHVFSKHSTGWVFQSTHFSYFTVISQGHN